MIKNKLTYFLSLVLFAGLTLFSACSSDDDAVAPIELPGEDGFFVINEGLFGGGNASLSFYDKETGKMQNDIFFTANGRDLGDQAQSMTIIDTLGYVVVQNSNKIDVIDLDDFTSVATIDGDDGLVSPRYILAVSSTKAYVTDWGADGVTGTVKVLNLETNKITKTVATGAGSNKMVKVNNRVFVANSGGYSSDNTIAVINSDSDELIDKIEVGDNPKAIQLDGNNDLWVVGTGKIAYNADWTINLEESTPGFISKISSSDEELIFTAEMTEKNVGPGNIAVNPDGDMLYLSYKSQIYTLDTDQADSQESIEMTLFLDKSFYGFSVDPSTGDFIGAETPNFTSAGTVYRYDNTGSEIDNLEVGIGPNGVAFK